MIGGSGGSGGEHVRERLDRWAGTGFYPCTEVFRMTGSPYSGFSSFLWD